MPITFDEIEERGKQRKQLLTLAEKQEISDQARGIGQQGQWQELVQELCADPELQEVFGDDICTELSVFKDTDKSIALQIVSGREGISLREADALVYFNIDFSATSYWQSRDRMTTKERLESDVYWICLLYTSPSPRDKRQSRMPSSA